MGEFLMKKVTDWIYKNPNDCVQIRKRITYVAFGLVFIGISLVVGSLILMNSISL